jgi:hypothetical protein
MIASDAEHFEISHHPQTFQPIVRDLCIFYRQFNKVRHFHQGHKAPVGDRRIEQIETLERGYFPDVREPNVGQI